MIISEFPGFMKKTTIIPSLDTACVRIFISLAKANCSSGRMALRSVIILMATTCKADDSRASQGAKETLEISTQMISELRTCARIDGSRHSIFYVRC